MQKKEIGKEIIIKGARVNNLKSIDITIPREKLVVITGVSGSGKSSLAFDTIYAEGQRRYVESLSSYARQFLGLMEKPDVDFIEGLSPAISIDQKSISKNPRSTVGTITEIYDYLRLLFSRIGRAHCPKCKRRVEKQTVPQIAKAIANLDNNLKLIILAPLVTHKKGEHQQIFTKARKDGFSRVRVNGEILSLDEDITLERNKWHTIEVVVDRLISKPEMDMTRLTQSVETAISQNKGTLVLNLDNQTDIIYSTLFACSYCNYSLSELEPRNFSFNTPYGACPACTGLGAKLFPREDLVIQNHNLTIEQGAISPWKSKNGALYELRLQQLKILARLFQFKLDQPFAELDEQVQKLILYGVKNSNLKPRKRNVVGWTYNMEKFPGVLADLCRQYEQTESEYVRSELEKFMSDMKCSDCDGKRLKEDILAVTITGSNIIQVCNLTVAKLLNWLENCKQQKAPDALTERESFIGKQIFKELEARVKFLHEVGLHYISINRSARTLSGGEAQRIRLATQIGSGLTNVLYVCDEPSIGLHPADNSKLINTLKSLRDIGNSVIVVEHDEEIMREADFIVDLGPQAGKKGGYIVAFGDIKSVKNSKKSITGSYLAGKKVIPVPEKRRCPKENQKLIVRGAQENNLKNIDVEFPLNRFICVTGVSGSGKSSLVTEIIAKKLQQVLNNSKIPSGKHRSLEGVEKIEKIIVVNQAPIGRTPRSTPVIYTGAFTPIRELFAALPESKARGYKPGRFSFNMHGGRCEACKGSGYVDIEMQLLPDITVKCETCHGKRYNPEELEVEFKSKNIFEILEMTVEEGRDVFANLPAVKRRLDAMYKVGLGYMQLGQPATTLSGGEAQRVKLAKELSVLTHGQNLYVLDEPTTGLSFSDCDKLLKVLHELVNVGNTVILIEHNLDCIKNADWIIDMGPEGGENGGRILAVGTPEQVAKAKNSQTGKYLHEKCGI